MFIINLSIQLILILTFNIWFTNQFPIMVPKGQQLNDPVDDYSTIICHEINDDDDIKTIHQLIELFKQQPCAQIIQNHHHSLIKRRNTDANGNIDVRALQTTITDHRTMINYLINNSINATYVTDAIRDHYFKTGPSFYSWRDIIDIFTIIFFLTCFIYYCICRTGFSPCDKIVSFCCRPIFTRATIQGQGQEQEKRPSSKLPIRTQSRKMNSSVASVEGEIARFYNGYMSE